MTSLFGATVLTFVYFIDFSPNCVAMEWLPGQFSLPQCETDFWKVEDGNGTLYDAVHVYDGTQPNGVVYVLQSVDESVHQAIAAAGENRTSADDAAEDMAESTDASDAHLDLVRAPSVLYGVKCIDLVSCTRWLFQGDAFRFEFDYNLMINRMMGSDITSYEKGHANEFLTQPQNNIDRVAKRVANNAKLKGTRTAQC